MRDPIRDSCWDSHLKFIGLGSSQFCQGPSLLLCSWSISLLNYMLSHAERYCIHVMCACLSLSLIWLISLPRAHHPMIHQRWQRHCKRKPCVWSSGNFFFFHCSTHPCLFWWRSEAPTHTQHYSKQHSHNQVQARLAHPRFTVKRKGFQLHF